MSVAYAAPLVIEGYGLKEEDLDGLIVIGNLKDISQKFSKNIQTIQERFNSKTRIRIIEYNELS